MDVLSREVKGIGVDVEAQRVRIHGPKVAKYSFLDVVEARGPFIAVENVYNEALQSTNQFEEVPGGRQMT